MAEIAPAMGRAALVADLKASLMDAGKVFKPEDFDRMLDTAAGDMHLVRPRVKQATLTLAAGVSEYPAPADLLSVQSLAWGRASVAQPWEPNHPGPLPRLRTLGSGAAATLLLTPAPTGRQIALLGATCPYLYIATDVIGETPAETTIAADARGLLLLRAQAEAMLMLAQRDSVRPVQTAAGGGSQTKTGMPAALWQDFLAAFLKGGR